MKYLSGAYEHRSVFLEPLLTQNRTHDKTDGEDNRNECDSN